MEIIVGTTDFQLLKKTAVAIGKFDGVHLGHRRLLEEILEKKKAGMDACVFTFDPAPAVLFGGCDEKELTTKEEKRAIFERMGVDVLIEFPLSYETAAISPRDFIREILYDRMKVAFVAAGKDISFGNKGAGNGALLKQMAEKLDFEVKLIDKVCIDGQVVSSSYIREQVECGNMEETERFLGMPYTVLGKVVRGNQIGRTIGFPTVNLLPPSTKLLPPNGVYLSGVLWGEKSYRSISNIGYKPTVSADNPMGLETYLYDFDQEIYGEEIEVSLYSFMRPEKKFDGLGGLKIQLMQDITAGKERLSVD